MTTGIKKHTDAKTRSPDMEGLREFAQKSDRQEPPAFAGRKDQIAGLAKDLRTRTKDSMAGKSDAWEGATWLFQGAPGAGKTALLRHLQNLKIQAPAGNGAASGGVPVRACSITDQHVLSDPWELKKKIAAVWIPEAEKDLETRRLLELGADLKVIRGGMKTDRPLMSWGDVVKKVLGKPGEYPPLLLMVDEAQKLDDAAEKQVLWLHQGNDGLPIIPVFGGLAWTKERFGELGISRFSGGRVHTLEALSKDECREVVRAFFKKFRVAGSPQQREEWAETLARECRGWPQHLHAGLQGLAEALVEAEGVLEEADRPTGLEGGADRRQEYYEARISSFESGFHEAPYLAAAAVAYLDRNTSGLISSARLGRAIDQGHVLRLALNWPGMNLKEDDPDLSLPEGAAGKELVRAMLRAGIFHKGANGVLHVPIPSFADYLCSKLDWLAARSGESPQPSPPEPGM